MSADPHLTLVPLLIAEFPRWLDYFAAPTKRGAASTDILYFPVRVVVCMANCKSLNISWISQACYDCAMRDLAVLILHVLATVLVANSQS